MSRIERKIEEAVEATADAAEILAALAGSCSALSNRRRDAVTRYLSVGEGWKEASGVLRGAFAAGEAAGLRPEKDG